MTNEERNRKAIEDAETEIQQRSGRIVTLTEKLPMLESSLSKSIAAVENDSTHAGARLAGAEKRLALTRKSIVVHEHVIRELKVAAAGLKNAEKLRGIADDEFLDKLESDAVFEIGLYTRANGVVRNSDINYGYLTNLN